MRLSKSVAPRGGIAEGARRRMRRGSSGSERDTERRTEGTREGVSWKMKRRRRRRGRRRNRRRCGGGRRKRIHPSVTLWQTARESQCEASLFSPSLLVPSVRPSVRPSVCLSIRSSLRLPPVTLLASLPTVLASEIHLLSCPPPGSPFVPSLPPPQPPACYYVLFYCRDAFAKVRPGYSSRRGGRAESSVIAPPSDPRLLFSGYPRRG